MLRGQGAETLLTLSYRLRPSGSERTHAHCRSPRPAERGRRRVFVGRHRRFVALDLATSGATFIAYIGYPAGLSDKFCPAPGIPPQQQQLKLIRLMFSLGNATWRNC
jgi:hypothetical protein